MNTKQNELDLEDRTSIGCSWPFPDLNLVLNQKYDQPPTNDGPFTTKQLTEE